MLSRGEELAPPEKFISDNLTHKPSVKQSTYDNLAAGIATPNYALNSFDADFNQSPHGKTVAATFEALKHGNENSEVGWVQWGLNETANMLGQSLNPMTWALGELAGLAIKPAIEIGGRVAPGFFKKPLSEIFGEKMGKYFPKTIGTEEEEKTLSLGLLGEKWAKGFGIGAGVSLPQSVIDNFDAEKNKHDMLGIAKGMGVGGAFGMTLSTIPFAWGILKSNINRARGFAADAPIVQGDAEKAFEDGLIDKDTYKFWKELDEHKNNPESRAENKFDLSEKSTNYVVDQGHKVDRANNHAQFEILDRDQINNLQSATIDQLVSDQIPEEHRLALSDFIVQAGIDEMRNKPNLLDGVRGYVEYATENLRHREDILTKADDIVDQHIASGSIEEMPLSQNDIYEALKKLTIGKEDTAISYVEKAAAELPFHVPDNVINKIYRDRRVLFIENKNKKLFKMYEETGDKSITDQMRSYNNQLDRLLEKEKENPILNPKEELKYIQSKLFKTKLKMEQPDYYHVAPENYEEGNALKSLFSQKGIHSLSEFLKKWRYDLFEGDLPLVKAEIKVLKTHPKLVFLFKKNELDRAIEWLRENKGRVKTNRNKNKLLGIYDSANELRIIEELGYSAVPHEIPARYIKDITDQLHHRGLIDDFREYDSYKRLQELAEIWQPAKTLLDRIHLEDDINRQEAYRDLAKTMLDIADSNVSKLADREKVNNYLEARTKQNVKVEHEVTEVSHDVPADADVVLAEQDRKMEKYTPENVKVEYEAAKEKFNEFKKSENIFKNFVNCVLGSQQ